jgi:hypothetical protein
MNISAWYTWLWVYIGISMGPKSYRYIYVQHYVTVCIPELCIATYSASACLSFNDLAGTDLERDGQIRSQIHS